MYAATPPTYDASPANLWINITLMLTVFADEPELHRARNRAIFALLGSINTFHVPPTADDRYVQSGASERTLESSPPLLCANSVGQVWSNPSPVVLRAKPIRGLLFAVGVSSCRARLADSPWSISSASVAPTDIQCWPKLASIPRAVGLDFHCTVNESCSICKSTPTGVASGGSWIRKSSIGRVLALRLFHDTYQRTPT